MCINNINIENNYLVRYPERNGQGERYTAAPFTYPLYQEQSSSNPIRPENINSS